MEEIKSNISDVLDKYNAKVYKNRKKHIVSLEEANEAIEIDANRRTVPGLINHRGCCYAGCKGVVMGPIKDVVTLTHGPIGCGFYSWATRRNKAKSTEDAPSLIQYCFSTDLQESDIVFGGERKLRQAIEEIMEIFKPKGIMICATCPVGLIGDDLQAIAAETREKYNIDCISFNCEGYRGVSQSAGHHIANNGMIKHLIGKTDYEPLKPSVNILGEYNIGADAWEIKRILEKIGYEVIAVLTGDSSIDDIKKCHNADLNLIQCHRSINYIAEMMQIEYGTDWMKANFIGIEGTIQTLRDIAKYFNNEELTLKTEAVIAEEISEIEDDVDYYKSKLTGKTAALFVGGSRSHHYQMLLKDFGVETLFAGYEFAHRDDYEGREIIPDIIPDADLKNVETITVEKVEGKYRELKTKEEIEELKLNVEEFEYYKGMMKDMDKGAVVVDDLNHFETEEFIKQLKPDMFFSGIKDKYIIQKGGILSRQLHSYDYSGPYAGFKGAVNFGRDVTMGVYTPAWGLVTPPWKTESILEGTFGGEK